MAETCLSYRYKDVRLRLISSGTVNSNIGFIQDFLERIESTFDLADNIMSEYMAAQCIYLWGELDYLESINEEENE